MSNEKEGGYSGYCLVISELGNEEEVAEKIKSYEREPGIKKIETCSTYGAYDIVANISADNENDFKNIIKRIRRTYDVRSTLTLVNLADIP